LFQIEAEEDEEDCTHCSCKLPWEWRWAWWRQPPRSAPHTPYYNPAGEEKYLTYTHSGQNHNKLRLNSHTQLFF